MYQKIALHIKLKFNMQSHVNGQMEIVKKLNIIVSISRMILKRDRIDPEMNRKNRIDGTSKARENKIIPSNK